MPGVYRGRIDSLRRLMDTLERELEVFTGIVRERLSADPGYVALRRGDGERAPEPADQRGDQIRAAVA